MSAVGKITNPHHLLFIDMLNSYTQEDNNKIFLVDDNLICYEWDELDSKGNRRAFVHLVTEDGRQYGELIKNPTEQDLRYAMERLIKGSKEKK